MWCTSGFTTFDVVYNVNGTWSVTPIALNTTLKLSPNALATPTKLSVVGQNVEIRNEVGTAIVSTGTVNNFNAPVTIQNLSNIGGIAVHSEYQVGPVNGPYVGRMCIDKNEGLNSATFR